MLSNYKKNKQGNLWHAMLLHAGGVLILVIFVILIIANVKVYKKRQEYLAQVSSLKVQVQQLENKNNALKEGMANSNDPQYIEKVAREQLDLQKEGEQAVSFVMPDTTQQKPQSKNPVQSWWEWLRSKF